MDQVNFFKGCVSQILLGPFLNTLPQIFYSSKNIQQNILRFMQSVFKTVV